MSGQAAGGRMKAPATVLSLKATCPHVHATAPLTPAGRLRLSQRCQTYPIAHVAAEAGVSHACLAKWVDRVLARLRPLSGAADTISNAGRIG